MDEYENDPEDGHEHEFIDDELDLAGNGNTIICMKCGLLSIADEGED